MSIVSAVTINFNRRSFSTTLSPFSTIFVVVTVFGLPERGASCFHSRIFLYEHKTFFTNIFTFVSLDLRQCLQLLRFSVARTVGAASCVLGYINFPG